MQFGDWAAGVASRSGSSPDAARGEPGLRPRLIGTLYYGGRKTVVKDRKKDLSRGVLADMLKQLGLDARDLE